MNHTLTSRRISRRTVGLLLLFTLVVTAVLIVLKASLASATTGSIGDLVWIDSDGDGTFNTGEPGLAGVPVALTGAGPDIQLGTADDVSFTGQTTDASGAYSFTDLSAGLYKVDVDSSSQPDKIVSTTNDPLVVNLGAGQAYATADFGLARPEWVTLSINTASVTSVAGNGTDATVDGTGTGASFKDVGGVVVVGNFAYIGTRGSIRKVNVTTGEVTTLAGHATENGCTNSNDATAVRFSTPIDLATDGTFLYRFDACDFSAPIRRVSLATGATSQVTSFSNGAGLAFGRDGYLYATVAGSANGWVYRVNPSDGATSTFYTYTRDDTNYSVGMGPITSDSTHLWLVVSTGAGGYRIDKIALSDATKTTVVGTGNNVETGSLVAAGDYLYGTANSDHTLRRYAKTNGSWVNVAGTTTAGYADGTGTDAWLSSVNGVTTDGASLWIADRGNRRLRKAVAGTALPGALPASATTMVSISPAAVTTFAGNGSNATFDGTGTGASFKQMGGVVIVGDYAYVSTEGSIRKVNLSDLSDPVNNPIGEVTTLAGHATQNGCTRSPDPTTVRLNYPVGLVTDGYYLYRGDAGCNALVTRTSISTGATSNVTSFLNMLGLTYGGDGYLYVAVGAQYDCTTNYIYKVDPINGTQSVFATLNGDPGGWCMATGPAMTSDASHLFVIVSSGQGGWRLERLALSDASRTTLVGNGTNLSNGALVSAGNYLYATGASDNILRRIAKADGSWIDIAGTSSAGYADATGSDAWFSTIKGIASDGTNLWVADSGNKRLRKAGGTSALPASLPASSTTTLTVDSAAVTTFAGDGLDVTTDGTGTGSSFKRMAGTVVVGNFAYVATQGSIRKVNLATGEVSTLAGHATQDGCTRSPDPTTVRLNYPVGLVTDGYYLYRGDAGCNALVTRTSISTGATSNVTSFLNMLGLTYGGDGYLYVAVGAQYDCTTNYIYKVDPINGTQSVFATFNGDPGGWCMATGPAMTSDASHLFVIVSSGRGGWRLERLALSDASRTTLVGNGTNLSNGALVSAGNYLYATAGNDRILRRISKSDGSTLDVAGSSVPGYVDDIGSAARFSEIRGLASDGKYLWVADNGNKRLRVAGSLAVLMAGGPNFGYDGYGAWAEDVNAGLGNFVNSHTDLDITTGGPDLELTRTYNSLDDRIGSFGKGWSHNYEMFWQAGPGDGITVLFPDGRREIHTKNPDGSYSPPAGYFSKLTSNGSGGYNLKAKDGTVYGFRSDGKITSITDDNGLRLSLSYDGAAKLTEVISDVSGRKFTFTWNGDYISQVATNSVSAHGGPLSWKYYYSGNKLVNACDPRDNAQNGFCFTYTNAGTGQKLSLIAKPRGNTEVIVQYLSDGKVDWRKDGLLNTTDLTYVSKGVVDTTDPLGNTTRQEYDGKYRLVKETNPLGKITTHEYDIRGNRTKTTDANGTVSEMTYDVRGNLLTKRLVTDDVEGKTTFMEYDSNDNMTVLRDPRSANSTDNTFATTFQYDAAGNKTEEKTPATAAFPNGTTKKWIYTDGTEVAIGGGTTPAGLLEEEKDGRNNAKTYKYDSKGDLRETLDREDLKTEYVYDEIGRKLTEKVISDTFPLGVTATFTYDVLGKVLTTTSPSVKNEVSGVFHQQKVTNVYDGNENVVTMTVSDLIGGDDQRVTEYSYDAVDRETSVKDPLGFTMSRTYDPAGNVDTVTDQEGRVIDTDYDARNLATTVTVIGFIEDPVGGSPPENRVLKTFTYDDAGRKKTETDAEGRTTDWTYDRADHVKSVALKSFDNRDGSTRDITLQYFDYDAAGNVITEKSHQAGSVDRIVNHSYDAAGRKLTSTLDPSGLNRVASYDYDENGNVTKTTISGSGRTEERRHTFDKENRKKSETVENGDEDLVATFYYDQKGNLTGQIDPRGNPGESAAFKTSMAYDEVNRLIRVTQPSVQAEENGGVATAQNPVTEVGYNTFGNQTHSKDARNKITTSTFDKLNRRTGITHPTYINPDLIPVAASESFEFDKVGNLTSRTDRRDETTDFTFDKLNRVVQQLEPLLTGESSRGEMRVVYDKVGNRTSVEDQRGAKTNFTYDDLNRVRTETKVVRLPGGSTSNFTTTFDYDDLGNQTYLKNPSNEVTTRDYSMASELLKETDPLLKETSLTYDLASRVIRKTDELGRYSENSYDLAGRLTSTKNFSPANALPNETKFGYDKAGNQTATTSPRNFVTSFEYDAMNRVTQVVEPVSANVADSITTTYGYDAAGNTTRVTAAAGSPDERMTVYTFQAWNLPEKAIEPVTTGHPADADRTFTTSYDKGGLPVKDQLAGGVLIHRTFDELGRPTCESESPLGCSAPGASRSFGYDKASFRTEAGHPGANQSFVYDDRGLLTSSAGGAGTSSFTYDNTGRMLSRTDASGTATFTYDTRGELKTAADPQTATTLTFNYDDASQVQEVVFGGGATPPKRDLDYDDLGRITADTLKNSAGDTVASYGYGYDPDGNLTTQQINHPGNSLTGTHNYEYDRAGRISKWVKPGGAEVPYTWDKAGNRKSAGESTYLYDQRNRLIQSTEPALPIPGLPQASVIRKFNYTPRGTLSSIVDPVAGQALQTFTFDALSRLTAFQDPTQTISYSYDSLDRIYHRGTATFSYAGADIDPATDGNFTFARTPAGKLLSVKKGSDALLAGKNRHGDLTYLFNPSAQVSDTKVFDPFGEVGAKTGSTDPTLGFQSDFTDPASERVWMGSRWYGPNEAQFLSRDSVFGMLQTPISLNRYTYANGDPLNYFDPDGRLSCRLEVCQKVKRGAQKVTRGARQVVRTVTGEVKTAAAAVGETIQIQAGRAQHRAIAAKQRVEKTVRQTLSSAKANVARTRRDIGRLQTKIADTQIGGARLRDWGAAYADEQTAKDAIGGLKSLSPPNMYRSLEQAGGDAVDEYIAATGDIPTDAYTLFNVAVNPAYRMLDKCTGDVTGFSAGGCAMAAVETVGTAMALEQVGKVGLQGAKAAISASTRATAQETVNVLPSSGKTFVGTPRGTVYDIPKGWAPRAADNAKGIVYQQPGATGNANSIRIMEPTSKYPSGHVRYYNRYGQPLDVYGKPGPSASTHIPQDYVGPWPGWPQ